MKLLDEFKFQPKSISREYIMKFQENFSYQQ